MALVVDKPTGLDESSAMQKRSSTNKGQKHDVNRLVRSVVDLAVGNPIIEDPLPIKNPGAIAPGRLRSLKRGKARAEKVSPKKR
jgi:hypothetical protein